MTTRLAAVVIGIVFASAAPAAEVAGVKLDDKVRIAPNAPELVLNGAGVRTRVIVKVYVGALYLPEKKTTATEVLALPGAKRITLAMLRDLTAQQLSEALNEGFAANNAPPEQERYKAQLAELLGIMNGLGQAKKGEVIALDYVPDSGTRVLVNGDPKGKAIPDEGFYRAVLRIWLGDKPADADLKKGLLGQS
jgi:hypothetical protein